MSNLAIGYAGLGVLLFLVLLRMPLGLALGGVSFIGIWVMISERSAMGIIASTPYNFAASWSLSSIPMFLLMGFLCHACGLTTGLFRLARHALGWLPGGLGVATIGGAGLFSAVSGSSVACAAAMGRITVPEMMRAGYNPGFAGSIVAVGGTIGSMIPPSIVMIIYGIFAQVSISQLFIAGLLPGLLTALMFALVIMLRVRLNPALAPQDVGVDKRPTLFPVLLETWPMLVLIVCILGGIFGGFFTATQAGAVGAALTLIIAVARGALTWRRLASALQDTLETTASIFLIAVGATLFTRFLALSGVPAHLAQVAIDFSSEPLVFVIGVSLIFLILGMFLEPIGIMLLTLPLLLPIFQMYDINLIWMGILIVKYLEISLVTPPVGLNLYVVKSMMGNRVGIEGIIRNTGWFLVAELVTLALLISFPAIALYLPSLISR